VGVAVAFDWARGQTQALSPITVDILFPAMAFLTGGLGGTIFAFASTHIASIKRSAVDVGALAYSLDLCGATLAGFTTGFIVLPSLGITGSAVAITTFNVVMLAVVLGWTIIRRSRSR
jgi:Na+-driven multidrug efflux pump